MDKRESTPIILCPVKVQLDAGVIRTVCYQHREWFTYLPTCRCLDCTNQHLLLTLKGFKKIWNFDIKAFAISLLLCLASLSNLTTAETVDDVIAQIIAVNETAVGADKDHPIFKPDLDAPPLYLQAMRRISVKAASIKFRESENWRRTSSHTKI